MAELSAEARNNLKGGQFVFPKERRYPISDIAHARDALARSSGKSEEDAVKTAVFKKYPTLKAHDKHVESGEPADDCAHCMQDAEGKPTAEDTANASAAALAAEHDEKHGRHEDCPNCQARKDGACEAHSDDTLSPNGPTGNGSTGGEREEPMTNISTPITVTQSPPADTDEEDKENEAEENEEETEQEHADSAPRIGVGRYDRTELEKPQFLDNGWARVDGFISRSGMLTYMTDQGKPWIEYRPPEEAFHDDSLKSFDLVPMTNEHPREGMLDAENTREYAVGMVADPRKDGDKVRARILVTDAAAVAAMKRGRVELSCGYTCDVDNTPGTIGGQRYDAIQRNVRGNHVALVDSGRAGGEVRVRMDGLAMVQSFEEKTLTHKIKIDGVDFDVSEGGKQAFERYMKTAQVEIDKQKARADGAESQAKKLQADAKLAPEKIRAEISARVSLENEASKILGETKFDGKSNLEIKRAVVEHVREGVKLDGKSDAYVEAAYELAVESFDTEPGLLANTPGRQSALETTDGSDEALKFLEASMGASSPKVRK